MKTVKLSVLVAMGTILSTRNCMGFTNNYGNGGCEWQPTSGNRPN
jgi:hypothetical protein